MCPGILRMTDPRFLSSWRHKDLRHYLKTQAGDLSIDGNVDRLVTAFFAKENPPGLDSTFWRFENIEAINNPELAEEMARAIKQSDRTLGSIARILLEKITEFSGYERTCVKFPLDVKYLPELIAWFPDCRVVHITRDPRAMAMSKTNDPSGTARKVSAHPRLAGLIRKMAIWFVIAQYRSTSRLHARFKHLKNYRLFKYEDLLADPEKVLRELCDFIGAEFTPDMLQPQKGRHEHQPSSLTGKQQKAFDARAAIRWQNVISPLDRRLITTLTRRSMRRLGYDPETHAIFEPQERQADSGKEALVTSRP
jgi:hypothetical protein